MRATAPTHPGALPREQGTLCHMLPKGRDSCLALGVDATAGGPGWNPTLQMAAEGPLPQVEPGPLLSKPHCTPVTAASLTVVASADIQRTRCRLCAVGNPQGPQNSLRVQETELWSLLSA